MRSLEVLGAGSGEVTGSAFVLTDDERNKYIVDLGGFQGSGDNFARNKAPLSVDLSEVSAAFLTHSHYDHAARLFHIADYNMPIFATRQTIEIARIILADAARITPGLAPNGSYDKALDRATFVDYDKPFKVNNLTVTYRNAGHVLGSASIEIEEKNGQKTVVSGDLGNPASRIVKAATPIKWADIVLMESTYGDRDHQVEGQYEVFMEAVNWIRNRKDKKDRSKGKLLVPLYSFDRTQKFIWKAKKAKKEGNLSGIQFRLDSPMGAKITDHYSQNRSLLDPELQAEADPFGFDGLETTGSIQQSENIHNIHGPVVIYSSSGMMNGGRVGGHAIRLLSDPNNAILINGYAAEGTPSRQLLEDREHFKINGVHVEVNAQVFQSHCDSAHAGQSDLINWWENLNGERPPRHTVIIHGDNRGRTALASELSKRTNGIISTPDIGTIVDFTTNGKQAA
jgi:metallo-beta-lactamase family protein